MPASTSSNHRYKPETVALWRHLIIIVTYTCFDLFFLVLSHSRTSVVAYYRLAAPGRVRSIAISVSVSVGLSVCLSVASQKPRPNFTKFSVHVTMWLWLGILITILCYVAYFRFCGWVLWMTLCFRIMGQTQKLEVSHVANYSPWLITWRRGRSLLSSIAWVCTEQ